MENKKINITELTDLTEILKDCPSGMELNCLMYEDVYFDYVVEHNMIHCYIQHETYKTSIIFNQYGVASNDIKSKCVIFPKGKTTWEGFAPPYRFKDGDILFVKATYSWIIIYKECGYDVDLYKYVGIPVGIPDYPNYTFMVYDCNPLCCKKEVSEIRLATEEEKEKLFDAIKENGYKWNPENNALEKLPKFKVGDKIRHKTNNEDIIYEISAVYDDFYGLVDYAFMLDMKYQDSYELVQNKFDITTLKPFESKVLVRDTVKEIWKPDFFGCLCDGDYCPYMVVGGIRWKYCIPYEGNERLLGTANDCDEYYKTWE